MPAMFGSRRHAPPVQPLTRETADPNAATAAASAFMRRDSNASLSSAAAAAALRARPMTPTNVSQVQSRRTHRRSPSMSSLASGDRVSRRELQRTPSVGSMIERTFRSPSPGSSPTPRDRNVPPVPRIPKAEDFVADETTNGGQRKGATLQTQPFRTASEKMKDGQHGSWFGGATTARDPGNVRSSDSTVLEPRPGSVSPSINFSYPRARMQSPPPPSIDDRTLVYDANSRRMVPRGELVARSYSVRESSEKPKKKKNHDIVRSASHLSRGTVERTQAPALETPPPLPAAREPEPAQAVASEQPPEPVQKRKKKKPQSQQQQQQQQQQHTGEDNPPVVEHMMDRDSGDSTAMARPPLVKKPSVVAEEPEREAREEQEGSRTVLQPAAVTDAAASGPKSVANGKAPSPDTRQRGSVRPTRAPSESPARSAHFAPATDQLVIRHEPPARSVSPKKSAMKLSNPRSVSPSDDGSEASAGRGLSPQRQEDPALARKKSVRVSWDDRNTVVVGESAQPQETAPPVITSPQAKKPWHSIVTKYTRKEPANLDEDETMSPRPALPLFGSVRDKKTKDSEERPLVRPSERTWSQPVSALSETTTETGLGQSSEAPAGAASAQDQASRNAANISKYREPLPAAAPSAEEAAKETSVAESSDDDLDTDATSEPDDVAETTPPRLTERLSPKHGASAEDDAQAGAGDDQCIPTIYVSHPSPGPQDHSQNAFSDGKFDLPGGFPDEEDFSDAVQSSETSNAIHAEAEEAAPETPPRSIDPLHIATSQMMDDIEETEEADRCSVYSDAYEDLDEVDGDGFMSLDAVVESPAGGKLAKKLQEQVTAQSGRHVNGGSQSPASATNSLESWESSSDWEKAKAYWKNLSIGQRRQLEMEALTDLDSDPGLETGRANKDNRKQQATKEGTNVAPQPTQSAANDEDEAFEDAAKRASVLAAQPKGAVQDSPKKLRQSMRSEQPAQAAIRLTGEQPGGMRRSMRDGGPAHTTPSDRAADRAATSPRRAAADVTVAVPAAAAGMRKSLRAEETNGDHGGGPRPSLSQSGRPVSYQPPAAKKYLKKHKQSFSVEDLVPREGMKPGLKRRGSDDSVSSFTRSRASPGAGHGFRRSMRVSASQEPPSPVAAKGSGRFSLRSLSPPGFRRSSIASLPTHASSSSAGAGRFRQSLRGESADTGSRGRMSAFRHSATGGKKGKKASRGSRFVDSSDEEEGGPSLFRSRFADSSDDDDDGGHVVPRPRPKSTGLPSSLRSANKSSSTAAAAAARDVTRPDGPGSDEDTTQPRRGAAVANGKTPTLRHSRSGRGTLTPLPAATEGDEAPRPRSRRGSLLSILRRKKDGSGKISRTVGESAARRDTKLERTTEALAVMRSNSNSNSLHKRGGPGWPLAARAAAAAAAADDDDEASEGQRGGLAAAGSGTARPSTAGGPARSPRALLDRRSTSQGIPGLGGARDDDDAPPLPAFPPPQQPQQKKKFGALRKMFGIHD